jgi:hypothetical protein
MAIARIHELARTLPREAFAQKHTSLFLVVIDRGDDEAPISFETIDAQSAPRSVPRAASGVEVHEIAKAKGNPYKDNISVGRAPNCDVVLRYGSISKLHGYFQVLPDGKLEFTDVDSQVGTRLNGRPLTPNKAERVSVGSALLLGRITARITDARTVWDLLKAQEKLGAA